MKKTGKSIICALLCLVMLPGFIPVMNAEAANANRLDSLSAYYEFIKDEEANLRCESQDETLKKFYGNAVETHSILSAYLIDVTGDGIEELILKRNLGYSEINNFLGIYTYTSNGLKLIGQSEQWPEEYAPGGNVNSGHLGFFSYKELYYCTGSDGKAYFVDDHPTGMADDTRFFASYNGSAIVDTIKLESRFVPNWYVSPGISSIYGRYDFYVDDVKVSHEQFKLVQSRICSNFTELVDNNYRTVLNTLEAELKAYYTPSSWAAVEVNMAINSGYVPRSLQKKYTAPITRAEFCALATAVYESTTGKEITEFEYFDDTSDLNVQKMAGLGIVTGTGNGKFSPDKNLSRQEAATILARLAEALNMQTTEAELNFDDNDAIASWAKAPVSKVLSVGVMGGVGGNRFDPKGSYTREQAIMTIVRLAQLPIGAPVPVSSVTLSPSSLSLTVGEEVTVEASISPADATEKKLTWTSSDKRVAAVDKNGRVSALYEGEAIITATAPSGVSAECRLSVAPIKSSGISLDRQEAFLNVGKSLQLNAKLFPEDASTDHIVWTSSDESVAIVDGKGLVTAFREGTAVITAESFGETASCSITVSTAPLGLENFVKNSVYTGQFTDVPPGAWYAPNVAAAYEYGLMTGSTATTFNSGGNLTLAEALVIACRIHNIYYDNGHDFSGGKPWYQSYVDYAVDNGIIESGRYDKFTDAAMRVDFAYILASSVPAEALAPINNVGDGLMNNVPDLIPDVPAEYMEAPEIYRLYNAGILTGSGSYGDFQPFSSITRAEVAAIITRVADPALRRTFTLLEKEIPADYMFFLIDYEGMRIGESYFQELFVQPSNSTWKDFEWTSSNPSVATVDSNGNVRAVGSGDATITVTLNGLSASYNINVARKDIVYSGSGREMMTIDIPQGAWKVEYSHNGTGSFSMKGVYDTSKIIEDANNCSGVALFEPALSEDTTGYYIDVRAGGDWTLRFVEVNERISSNISGSNDCVPGLILCTGNTTVTADYDGTDYFSVDIYSLKNGRWELAVSEIGPFTDETRNIYPQKDQLYVVYVEGNGNWHVDFGYGDEPERVN